MSHSSRKRSPFGEAPADIGNRISAHTSNSNETETMASMTMARSGVVSMATAPPPPPPPYPPPSPAQKQKRRMQQQQQQQQIGSISSILGNGTGINTPSESSQHQRQQIDPPPLQLKNVTDNDDNATRARQYKAEAYEAKIRIASQEQRIQELQAEIEEMRLFQKVDSKSSNNTMDATDGQEKAICKDDAELIEALAEELETMEKDMNAAQTRVAELEQELREMRLKSEDYEASMMESASPYLREVELKKQLELQQQELVNAKNDAREGIAIVKDLHGALRLARAERDEARSNLSALRSEMEQYQTMGDATEQSAVVRDLEAALKTTRNERDEALLELSSLFEEVNSLRECSAICEKLEQANKSLQSELEILQNQSVSEMQGVHDAVVEAREREEKLKQEYNKLLEESKQMESALEEIVHKFEEQRNELAMKTAAIEELQDLHVTNIADLNKEHANEMETMRLCHEDAIQCLETRHAQELQKQNELLQSRESDWEAKMRCLQEDLTKSETIVQEYEAIEASDRVEIENLKNELKEIKTIADNLDMDRPHDELVAGLQLENAELHRQLEDHKQMVSELEASKSVLNDKKMLQKDEQVMQTETSSTQDESEAEATTSSSMRDESLFHSDQLSRIEQLERELARSKKANASLEDALGDMQVALVAVSSRKTSPSRKEIEDDALREYCAQRLLGDHSM